MSKFDTSLLKQLIKVTDNEFAGLASEEDMFTTMGFIDTGSYALNALLSGSIYGGAPNNRITGFSGESSTGKTYFTLACIKSFLDADPTAMCLYFDSEFALEPEMIAKRGIDLKRFAIIQVATAQEFRTQAVRILDKFVETPKEKRPKIIIALDSLGMLTSDAEVKKVVEGADTKDFTLLQVLKGTFRVLTMKLGRHEIPMFVAAHTYANLGGYGEATKTGGGSGFKYAASSIVNLSKSKYKEKKDSSEVNGALINCKMAKGRFTKEGKEVEVLLHNETGLDRYYGLLEIAERAGLATKSGNKWSINGSEPAFESVIIKKPEKFYTEDTLKLIDDFCQKEFKYGGGFTNEVSDDTKPVQDE